MRYHINKDINKLARLAVAAGWRVEKGGSHFKWFEPGHGRIIVVASTSGDPSLVHQLKRVLRPYLNNSV